MGPFLPGFLWPITAFPGSEPVFSITQGPPLRACASLSQDGFQRRDLWEVDTTYDGLALPLFLAPKEPLCTCVVGKVSSTSRTRTMWSLYLLSGQNTAPLCPCYCLYLGVSVHRGQTSAAQPGAHLFPASVPLHVCTDHIFFTYSDTWIASTIWLFWIKLLWT